MVDIKAALKGLEHRLGSAGLYEDMYKLMQSFGNNLIDECYDKAELALYTKEFKKGDNPNLIGNSFEEQNYPYDMVEIDKESLMQLKYKSKGNIVVVGVPRFIGKTFGHPPWLSDIPMIDVGKGVLDIRTNLSRVASNLSLPTAIETENDRKCPKCGVVPAKKGGCNNFVVCPMKGK